MRNLTHLNALQAVESALRNGSLKAAAEELGITPAAIGQRIRALEDYLGAPLLERGRHTLEPTRSLREALGFLQDGFESLNLAAEKLQLASLNRVSVIADPDWAKLWLQPRLAKFSSDFPTIMIDVNATSDDAQISRAADFTIFASAGVGSGKGETLYRDYWAPVASDDLCRRLVGFAESRNLEGLPLLHLRGATFGDGGIDWVTWVQKFGHRLSGSDRGAQFQSMAQAIVSAKSDVGFALCGLSLVLEELQSGRLKLAFDPKEGHWAEATFQLRPRQGALTRPHARRFYEWLLAEAAATASALERVVGTSGA